MIDKVEMIIDLMLWLRFLSVFDVTFEGSMSNGVCVCYRFYNEWVLI